MEFSLDGVSRKNRRRGYYDLSLAEYVLRRKRESTVFFRSGRARYVFAGEPNFCFVPSSNTKRRILDSAAACDLSVIKKNVRSRKVRRDFYLEIKNHYQDTRSYMADVWTGSVRGLSAVRMWNLSIVGAIIFGMFTMTMIYRYLGQGALAKNKGNEAQKTTETDYAADFVLAAGDEGEMDTSLIEETLRNYEEQEKEEEKDRQAKLEGEIRKLVKGFPIEKMSAEIAKKDRIVAAFLVSIAKKESDWGNRVPVLNGEDCYNYWGYRGIREKMGSGGHTCFDSPKDAVDTVAKRLEFLVSNKKLNTPAKMKIWKCGYDCSWDNPVNVKKWIADVDHYFAKLNH